MVNKGERFEDVKKMIEQSSVQLTPIGVSTLKNPSSVKSRYMSLLKTKSEILNKYNIREEHLLEEAVELVKNTNHRIIYKYNYGIGIKRILKEKILDLLDIDEIEYKQALLEVQQELPTLIEEALKNRKVLAEYNQIRSASQPIKKKTNSRKSKEKVKPVEKIDNFKAGVVENLNKENVVKQEQIESKRGREGKKYFLDYFVSSRATEEEKTHTLSKIKYYIKTYIPENHEGYRQTKNFYGEDLLQERRGIFSSEHGQYYEFVKGIKKYLNGENIKKRPLKFVDYFTTYEMSGEEREKRIALVESCIKALPKNTTYYKIGEILYGEGMMETYTQVKIDTKQRASFIGLLKNVNTYIESFEKGNKTNEFIKGITRRKQYFLENFISLNADEVEKEKMKRYINYFIEYYVDEEDIGYKVAQAIYGETLFEEATEYGASTRERDRFHHFINTIKNFIENGKIKRHPLKFIGYFTTPEMSVEEIRKTEQNVYKVLNTFSKKTLHYQAGQKMYGEDFRQKLCKDNISDTLNTKVYILISKIKKELLMEKEKENLEAFFTYAIEHLEQLENKEEIIETILTSYPKYFNVLIHSKYFQTLFETLTEKEGELVYLKLLQRINLKLTDEDISKITGLTVEEIATYQIMTKEDTLNQINQYIKIK